VAGNSLASGFSYSIFGTEDTAEVPPTDMAQERLLEDRQLSKSALRAFELLELFAQAQRPIRAVEVAHALELSPSSADQLLKSLASRAYLMFDAQNKLYRPSPRLLRFGDYLERSYYGGNRLQEMARFLAEKTQCSVSICTPIQRRMQLVEFTPPPDEAPTRQPGEFFAIFNSAAGAAMLASWPISTVRALIKQSVDQLGALAARPSVVLSCLDEVRANGHAFGGITETDDQCAIAVALPANSLDVELTLSVRGSISHLKAHRWRFSALIQEAIAEHLEAPASG